jgi:ribosomal protein S18 acetylase RimI-like enzyme
VTDTVFANPVLHSLQTRQRHLAQYAGSACKYQTDVAPFAAVSERTPEAMRDLHSLLAPGEATYMMGLRNAPPLLAVPGLKFGDPYPSVQMAFPENAALPELPRDIEIHPLSCANAPEMLALIEVAFPGFFRVRTCEMGRYYGIRAQGRLVAMAGERMAFDRYVEVSGVCTHPDHRGHGYAAALITRLLADHRRDGSLSFLHTGADNHRAIALYERLGFVLSHEIAFQRVVRNGP